MGSFYFFCMLGDCCVFSLMIWKQYASPYIEIYILIVYTAVSLNTEVSASYNYIVFMSFY